MICFGGSHAGAIEGAARVLKEDIHFVYVRSFPMPFVQANGCYRLHSTVVAEIERGRGPVFSVIGGNTHNVMGLVRHPTPFDFILPDQPELATDPKAEIIPYATIKAVLERRTQFAFDQLQALASRYRSCLFHVESPPPVRRRLILATPNRLTKQIEEHGLAPAMLRYRLWRLHGTIIRSYCDKLGVPFIPVPPESIDKKGFLLAELTGNATHGNKKYGALVIARMKAAADDPSIRVRA